MSDPSFIFVEQAASTARLSLRPQARTAHVVVLRLPSGLSGDMLVTGLARLADIDDAGLEEIVRSIGLPELFGVLSVQTHQLNHISGWRARVNLPREHAHRTLSTILGIIERSQLSAGAQRTATRAFQVLAEAESRVHGIALSEVSFHEVGALDSILDTCVAAALLDRLAPDAVHCGPLPLCDGMIRCEHGLIASPAPAVQEMLSGVPVRGVPSEGETVTPTALAFLLASGVRFGEWPAMTVQRVVRAYGGRVLPGIPNGAIFALGQLGLACSTSQTSRDCS